MAAHVLPLADPAALNAITRPSHRDGKQRAARRFASEALLQMLLAIAGRLLPEEDGEDASPAPRLALMVAGYRARIDRRLREG